MSDENITEAIELLEERKTVIISGNVLRREDCVAIPKYIYNQALSLLRQPAAKPSAGEFTKRKRKEYEETKIDGAASACAYSELLEACTIIDAEVAKNKELEAKNKRYKTVMKKCIKAMAGSNCLELEWLEQALYASPKE